DTCCAQDAEVTNKTTSVVLLAAQFLKEGRDYIECQPVNHHEGVQEGVTTGMQHIRQLRLVLTILIMSPTF
ncbi:hypothetical protein BDR04DRAFT_999302, partial [Suillus decipiens]